MRCRGVAPPAISRANAEKRLAKLLGAEAKVIRLRMWPMVDAKKTIRVTQTGSPIRRRADQRATLIGLGLNKMNKTRELKDTSSVRGMINKVKHLLRVEDVG